MQKMPIIIRFLKDTIPNCLWNWCYDIINKMRATLKTIVAQSNSTLTHVSTHIYTCIYVYTYTHIYVYLNICIYVHYLYNLSTLSIHYIQLYIHYLYIHYTHCMYIIYNLYIHYLYVYICTSICIYTYSYIKNHGLFTICVEYNGKVYCHS